MNQQHEKFMAGALAMARRGLGLTAPNPSVGAVIVRHDSAGSTIIARAHTGVGGTPHAEPLAIERAGPAAKGASLYVTLEPCNHHGRTPPCTEAIINAGLARVIIAATDNDSRVNGSGIKTLEDAGIKVITGVLANQAASLNAGHFTRQAKARPFTRLKIATSQNGLILKGKEGGHDDQEAAGPRWVTSVLARRRASILRLEADAIMVGSETARVDDPALTCRLNGCAARSPRPVILDRQLRLPEGLRLFQKSLRPGAAPALVAHSTRADETLIEAYGRARHVELLAMNENPAGQLDVGGLMHALARKGITRLLVEGGPILARSMIQAGLIDELIIFKGDFEVGNEGVLPFSDHPLNWAIETGGFVLVKSRKIKTNQMQIYQKALDAK